MNTIRIVTQYIVVCHCGNECSEPYESELDAIMFARQYPTCPNCEAFA